jgi:hypothetical protein
MTLYKAEKTSISGTDGVLISNSVRMTVNQTSAEIWASDLLGMPEDEFLVFDYLYKLNWEQATFNSFGPGSGISYPYSFELQWDLLSEYHKKKAQFYRFKRPHSKDKIIPFPRYEKISFTLFPTIQPLQATIIPPSIL